VKITDISRAIFKVEYFTTRKSYGAVIGNGYTILAGFDYRTHRLKRIPASFVDKVSARQAE